MNDLVRVLRGQRIDGRGTDEIMRLAADEIESLRSRLAKLQGGEACCVTHGEGACQLTCVKCNDELRSLLAEADALIAKGLAVVHDFLPNIGRCVLQDYQRMNEFCSEAAARTAVSAVQPERCCVDYPRCDCNSPAEWPTREEAEKRAAELMAIGRDTLAAADSADDEWHCSQYPGCECFAGCREKALEAAP